MSSRLVSPDTMTLLDKSSPLGSDDNSASLLDARGANSRASSTRSASTRTGDSTSRPAREKRNETTLLPGPVPHGQSLRSVVYYQNRFIVIDSTPAPPSHPRPTGANPPNNNTTSSSSSNHARALTTSAVHHSPGGGAERTRASGSASQTQTGSKRKPLDAHSSSFAAPNLRMASLATGSSGIPDSGSRVVTDPAISAASGSEGASGGSRHLPPRYPTPLEMDATSMTMDGRGIEIIVSDETGVSHRPDKGSKLSGKRAMLKRIGTILLDNRMKGKENCEHLLTEHPEEYRVLKKVLNIIFVTVGVALLIAVFVVIVYTAVVGDPDTSMDESSQSLKSQSQNTTTEAHNVTTPSPPGV